MADIPHPVSNSLAGIFHAISREQTARLSALLTEGVTSAQALNDGIASITSERMMLAKRLISGAFGNILAAHWVSEGSGREGFSTVYEFDPEYFDIGVVRRNAISRSYYGAMHCCRSVLFYLEHEDVEDHGQIGRDLGKLSLRGAAETKELLDVLRKERNKADYSLRYDAGNSNEVSERMFQAARIYNQGVYWLADRGLDGLLAIPPGMKVSS